MKATLTAVARVTMNVSHNIRFVNFSTLWATRN